ncbi:structural maintenance of chromosome protein [Tieghemostelium lacteum]|uniref:Structural maintenance of chromosome protein n=1 Tax=Tieghemostelium lacteum TaxID=361077 RepID=A0A151ZCE3_TIELA|nr:structural maintenance of chromosome protein [Tieghemostelium lacteum]|eukprot:KYQ91623.1 structural maintenance of chromosome protein [Tieghemostelium lacteum]
MSNKRNLNGFTKHNQIEVDEEDDDINDRPQKLRRTVNRNNVIQEDEEEEEVLNGNHSEDEDELEDDFDASQPVTQSQKQKQTQREQKIRGQLPTTSQSRKSQQQNGHRTTTTTTTTTQSSNAQVETIESDSESDYEEEMNDDVMPVNNTTSESGIIVSISLENFMCHKHFEIKLGPNVNFISGSNGSGKSAVLVALIICLGAKAGFTNRGHKLTDLVRHDANQAIITVKLSNKGSEAYRPDKFGDAIIIERRISKTGTNGYKLKDATGKHTISDKFQDLQLILEQFNIQVDNPLSILMQDTSRQFLNSATPSDKYKLFLTATQLDQITKDYEHIYQHLEAIKSVLNKKNAMLEEMEKKVMEYETVYEELKKLVGLEKRIDQLKDKYVWSHVITLERSLAQKIKAVENHKNDMNQKSNKLAQIGDKLKREADEIIKVSQGLTETQNKSEKIGEERQALYDKIAEIEREESAQTSKASETEKKFELYKKRRNQQKNVIEETKRKNAQMRNQQPKQQDLERKRGEQEKINTRLEKIAQERPDREQESQQFKQALDDASRSKYGLQQEYNKLAKTLSVARASKTDNTAVFGDKVNELLASIKYNARMFSKPPIGPVGLLLKIGDDKWSFAIENCIGRGTLRGYLVATYEDGKALDDLGRRLGIQVEYTKCSFLDRVYKEVEDINNRTDQNLLTIYRAISSEQPVVLNYLVDSKKIHLTLLVSNRQEGERILHTGKPPPGIYDSYVADGAQVKLSKGGGNIYIGSKGGYATMLRANTDSLIVQTEQELSALKPRLDEKVRTENDLSLKYKKVNDTLMGMDRESNQLKRQQLAIENEIRTIEESMNLEINDDTTDLEAGLQEMEDTIKDIQTQLQQFREIKDTFNQKKIPFQREIEGLDKQERSIRGGADKLENQLKRLAQAERELKREENNMKINMIEQEKLKQTLLAEVEESKSHMESESSKALEICQRVPVDEDETPEILNQRIKDTQRQLDKERGGKKMNRQEALKLYKESKEKLDDIRDKCESMQKFRTQLSENLNNRYIKWQKLRKRIATRTGLYFNIFLTRKGYSGSLVFTHEEKGGKLDIQVQLHKNSKGNEGKGDTKTLSGGERSFSTVSLLLALWEAMECPFRAMDEFDVFMDEVNRRISIDLLLSKARENLSKQYIFVTPLSLNSIQPGPFIYIHKVKPPIRGQQTIIETSQHNS